MLNFFDLLCICRQLLFIFLLPALEVIFFCGAIGRDPTDLALGVVNFENNSCNFTDSNNNSSNYDGCDFSEVGCRFFDVLFKQKSIVRREFDDTETALKAVRDGEVCILINKFFKKYLILFFLKIWGMVETPANFSKFFLKRLWSSIDADVETLNKSSINVKNIKKNN